jgi:hypothetical protein
MTRITHYTTLDRFGNRPILSVHEVMDALGIQSRRSLPKEYGRFWAVYGKAV